MMEASDVAEGRGRVGGDAGSYQPPEVQKEIKVHCTDKAEDGTERKSGIKGGSREVS